MKIALIGSGRIGCIHAENIARYATLFGVYDIRHEAAEQLALRHKCQIFEDLDDLFSSPEVDAVVIASSTESHPSMIRQAAMAKKAILCEKPLSLNIEEAKACVDILKEWPVPFLMGFNRRFDPHFSQLRHKLVSGCIGNLEYVHIVSRDPSPPSIDYVRKSGGIFKDMTIHDFDMALWLLGEEPESIQVSASCLIDSNIKDIGDFDSVTVMMRTHSGALCTIHNSRRAIYGYDQRVEAFGSRGVLIADNPRKGTVTYEGELGCSHEPIYPFFLERYEEAYKRELAHFIAVVEGRERALTTVEDGYRALYWAEMATQTVEAQTSAS